MADLVLERTGSRSRHSIAHFLHLRDGEISRHDINLSSEAAQLFLERFDIRFGIDPKRRSARLQQLPPEAFGLFAHAYSPLYSS